MPPSNQNYIIFWKKYYPTIFSVAVILIIFAIIRGLISYSEIKVAEEKTKVELIAKQEAANPFKSIELGARAAYVFDLTTGREIFSKNAEAQLPLASLTKTMAAIVALEAVPDFTNIRISNSSLREEGDSGLKVGEDWPLRKILGFSLTASSNDGVRAIAETIGEQALNQNQTADLSDRGKFVNLMNQKSNTLGLSQTFFLNETGLDVSSSTSGAYGSARDVAKLFGYALNRHADVFLDTGYPDFSVKINDGIHIAKNTNKIVSEISGLVASKTGFTDLAGGNLVIAFDAGLMHPVIVSILGSTETGRFDDALALVKSAIEYLGDHEPRVNSK
jgi:D-alanyl-D-alanine carboxypeptidase